MDKKDQLLVTGWQIMGLVFLVMHMMIQTHGPKEYKGHYMTASVIFTGLVMSKLIAEGIDHLTKK